MKYKYLILLFISILIITSLSVYSQCVIPVDDLYINSNTTLCPGTYYVNDTNGNGVFIINNNGITIQGNNTKIIGNGNNYAFYIFGKSNITIKNINISNYNTGMFLYSSSNNTFINNSIDSNLFGIILYISNYNNIINNTVSSSGQQGIYIVNSQNNNLINNTITSNNKEGIYLYQNSGYNNIVGNIMLNNLRGIITDISSTNNVIKDNIVNNNTFNGILIDSNGNYILNNTVNYNYYGIGINNSAINNVVINNTIKENDGWDFYIQYCNNIVQNNIGSGNRPIKFFNYTANLQNEILSELILCNADNSNINNVTIKGSDTKKNNGLIIKYVDNANFTNIVSSNNYYGIEMWYSNKNNIINSQFNNNSNDGIILVYSTNNLISNSQINSNNGNGILLSQSTTNNNVINNNTINSNNYGIYLHYSTDNNITNNVILSNKKGVWIEQANRNNLENNTMKYNQIGVDLYNSFNSNLINNNITDSINYSVYFVSSNNTIFNKNTFDTKFYLFGVFNLTFSNVTILNQYGSIFYPYLNITQNVNTTNNINISYNYIEINSSALPNFNRSATLTLNGITYKEPKIVKDGKICNDCIILSYSNGIIVFNVTGFSYYKVIEGYIPPSAGIIKREHLNLTVLDFRSDIITELNKKEQIFILNLKNTGDTYLRLNLYDNCVDNYQTCKFCDFNETWFTLSPGQEKNVSYTCNVNNFGEQRIIANIKYNSDNKGIIANFNFKKESTFKNIIDKIKEVFNKFIDFIKSLFKK